MRASSSSFCLSNKIPGGSSSTAVSDIGSSWKTKKPGNVMPSTGSGRSAPTWSLSPGKVAEVSARVGPGALTDKAVSSRHSSCYMSRTWVSEEPEGDEGQARYIENEYSDRGHSSQARALAGAAA